MQLISITKRSFQALAIFTHEKLRYSLRSLNSNHHVERTRDLVAVIYVAAVDDFVGQLLIGLTAGRESQEARGIERDARKRSLRLVFH